ncbi:MAG: trypsin-like peptidase domain-containing protein [Thermoproteota archaeon]
MAFVSVLALLAAMIAASFVPFQASAQSDATDDSQTANNSSVLFEDRQLNNSRDLTFRDLFSKVNSSVVQITASGIPRFSLPAPPPDGEGNERLPPEVTALGSGFVIDKQGHVATNNHVIANARNVSVTFSDGSFYKAEVIGSDVFSDTAVLELQDVPVEKLVPLPLGNSSDLAVGDEVVAIGNPFGLTGSMSTGIVSGLGRLLPSSIPPGNNTNSNNTIIYGFSIPNIIQTDAAINPGNSGGPLLDLKGEVIGMNTAIFSASPFAVSSGVGFAVPSDTLKLILPALITNGSYVHPWIGVAGADVTPEIAVKLGLEEARGYLVIDVVMGGPADKAGIRGGDMPVPVGDSTGFRGLGNLLELGGDIILEVDDQTVNKIDDLLSYIESEKKVGDSVTLNVLRDGKMMPIDVVLSARPSPSGR